MLVPKTTKREAVTSASNSNFKQEQRDHDHGSDTSNTGVEGHPDANGYSEEGVVVVRDFYGGSSPHAELFSMGGDAGTREELAVSVAPKDDISSPTSTYFMNPLLRGLSLRSPLASFSPQQRQGPAPGGKTMGGDGAFAALNALASTTTSSAEGSSLHLRSPLAFTSPSLFQSPPNDSVFTVENPLAVKRHTPFSLHSPSLHATSQTSETSQQFGEDSFIIENPIHAVTAANET